MDSQARKGAKEDADHLHFLRAKEFRRRSLLSTCFNSWGKACGKTREHSDPRLNRSWRRRDQTVREAISTLNRIHWYSKSLRHSSNTPPKAMEDVPTTPPAAGFREKSPVSRELFPERGSPSARSPVTSPFSPQQALSRLGVHEVSSPTRHYEGTSLNTSQFGSLFSPSTLHTTRDVEIVSPSLSSRPPLHDRDARPRPTSSNTTFYSRRSNFDSELYEVRSLVSRVARLSREVIHESEEQAEKRIHAMEAEKLDLADTFVRLRVSNVRLLDS